MLLSWDRRILRLRLSGLCCPVLVRKQITPKNGTCCRVAQHSREDAAVQAGPHVGLVVFFCQGKLLAPFLKQVAKKGW